MRDVEGRKSSPGCTRDRDKLMVQCITNVSAVVVHLRGTAFKE